METLAADAFGTGCVELNWVNGVLTVGPAGGPGAAGSAQGSTAVRRFVMGHAGDDLLIGNWDCQGVETPALYRPSTGQVFEWTSWASRGHAVGPAKVIDTGILDGVATVVSARVREGLATAGPDGTRCARVLVRDAESSR